MLPCFFQSYRNLEPQIVRPWSIFDSLPFVHLSTLPQSHHAPASFSLGLAESRLRFASQTLVHQGLFCFAPGSTECGSWWPGLVHPLSHSDQNHQWVVTLLMKRWALMKAKLVKALVDHQGLICKKGKKWE